MINKVEKFLKDLTNFELKFYRAKIRTFRDSNEKIKFT